MKLWLAERLASETDRDNECSRLSDSSNQDLSLKT